MKQNQSEQLSAEPNEEKTTKESVRLVEVKESSIQCDAECLCIATTCEGNIYVIEKDFKDNNNRFMNCYQPDGTPLRGWVLPEYSGRMVVCVDDHVDPEILVRMLDVPKLATFPPGVLPICAGYLGTECIAVSSFYLNIISVYTVYGKLMHNWGSNRLCYPRGMAFHQGLLYVASEHGFIEIFRLDGTPVDRWMLAQRFRPLSIAIGKSSIYVVGEHSFPGRTLYRLSLRGEYETHGTLRGVRASVPTCIVHSVASLVGYERDVVIVAAPHLVHLYNLDCKYSQTLYESKELDWRQLATADPMGVIFVANGRTIRRLSFCPA